MATGRFVQIVTKCVYCGDLCDELLDIVKHCFAPQKFAKVCVLQGLPQQKGLHPIKRAF